MKLRQFLSFFEFDFKKNYVQGCRGRRGISVN